jgi:hypothetical protein
LDRPIGVGLAVDAERSDAALDGDAVAATGPEATAEAGSFSRRGVETDHEPRGEDSNDSKDGKNLTHDIHLQIER